MRAAALFACLALVLGAAPAGADSVAPASDRLAPLPADAFTRAHAAHLLRRAGFGGPPAEIAALHARGLDGAVAHLLDYETIPGGDLPAFVPEITERPNFRQMRSLSEDERRRQFQQYRRRDIGQLQVLRAWWFDRMVRTKRPLEERMTLFWHGHFTSGFRDVRNSYHMFLQNTLLRRHAVGNFGALTKQVARDPAMLEYLDNRVNKASSPNENFARELLELFTLGVGNYTEHDIKEAARAFTGWTFMGNRFVNRRFWHDAGAKTVFGQTGRFDGDGVIDLILARPQTARYIATRLFRYFAHPDPDAAVIEGLARTLRESGYQLKPVLRQLFRSQVFYGAPSVGTRIKSPIDLTVGLARNLRMDPSASIILVNAAARLGQSLLDPPNVKGWPGGRDWITTSTLFNRYNTCQLMAGSAREWRMSYRFLAGRIRGLRALMKDDGMDPEAMAELQFLIEPKPNMRPFDILAATRGCTTAEQVVERLTGRFLAVETSLVLHQTLLDHARRGRLDDPEHLHGLLKLIVSTPEFQLS